MSTTITDDVRTYLEAVRARLADLPAEEREHLVSDAEPSLLEGEGSPYVRLGPPDRFADELRSAAGFPPPVTASPVRSSQALDAVRRVIHHPLVRELAPLWWVARAYLVLALLAQFIGGWAWGYPWAPVFHNARETLALGFIAVAVSMAVGLRRRRPRTWFVALNVAVLVVGLPVAVAETASHAAWRPPSDTVVSTPVAGLAYDGQPVTNVYPYDRRGHLLQDVRLYDQAGHPLDLPVGNDSNRRVPRSRSGRRFANAYPIRYFKPHSHRVAHPAAGARSAPPALVTKPVR